MRFWFIFVAALSLNGGLAAQNLEFYREDLTFTLCSDSLRVEGDYYFRNTGALPIQRALFYPFPSDAGKVTRYSCTDIGSHSLCAPASQNGFNFTLSIAAVDSFICHMAYTQLYSADSMRYILTSTQTWGQALEEGNYVLYTTLPGVKTSYPADSCTKDNGQYVFRWRRTNFLPRQDFIFYR